MQFHDRQKERHRYRHYHKVISSLFISSKRKVLASIFTRTLRNSGKWKHFVILIPNVPNCSPLKTMSNVNLILLNRGVFDTRFLLYFNLIFLIFFALLQLSDYCMSNCLHKPGNACSRQQSRSLFRHMLKCFRLRGFMTTVDRRLVKAAGKNQEKIVLVLNSFFLL